jgi:transketolase
MGLEDLAALRAIHGSTVLYPCDANQTVALVEQMAARKGISYLRTTRAGTSVLYDAAEEFPIGGSKTLRASDDDHVTIVAAGITVTEALAAADALERESIRARVIDAYSIKPIDAATLIAAAEATGGRIVTVEDHAPAGGLGEAVLAALAAELTDVRLLAVREMPGSGKPAELLAAAGIDAEHIVDAVRELVMRRELAAR